MNLQTILDFLAQPPVRWALALLGGWLMKKSPAFVTKAIPFAIFIGNFALSLMDALFGPQPAPVAPASFMLASTADTVARLVLHPLTDALVNTLLAVGTHSGGKNLWEWIRAGAGLIMRPRAK